MKLKQIEPVKMVMRLYGHEIEIIIHKATHQWLYDKMDSINILQVDSIVKGLAENLCCGQLSSTTGNVPDGDIKENIVKCEGEWRIIPDYNLWKRIFGWWYNHDFDEALAAVDFCEAYGNWKGNHYFDKWISFERNIPKMIGYIGNNMEEGRAFLDRVMKKVRQYENRINQES
jgi:hypothetical protein